MSDLRTESEREIAEGEGMMNQAQPVPPLTDFRPAARMLYETEQRNTQPAITYPARRRRARPPKDYTPQVILCIAFLVASLFAAAIGHHEYKRYRAKQDAKQAIEFIRDALKE